METLCFQSQPSQPSCLLILCTRLLTNLFFASSVCSPPYCYMLFVTAIRTNLHDVSVLNCWTNFSLNRFCTDDGNRVLSSVIRSNTMQLIAIDPAKYYTSGDSGTIGSHKIRQTRVQKDIVYHFFFPRTTREWNRLPESVLESGSLAGNFRNRVNTIPWTQTHLY